MRIPDVYSNVLGLIGNTPLVHISSLSVKGKGQVYAKLENANPSGSVKDRIVKFMLENAAKTGLLKGVDTIVEASSGNTAISIAMLAARFGLKAKLFIPSDTSAEKKQLIKSFGAEMYCVSSGTPYEGCTDYMQAARVYAKGDRKSYLLDQYNNALNTEAHFHGLGKEVSSSLGKKINFFVATGSTGGTISGVGRQLKENDKRTQVILADPQGSIYYSHFYGTRAERRDLLRRSKVEGAGKTMAAQNMDFGVIDRVVQFNDAAAVEMTFHLHQHESLIVGLSSGANALVASRIAREVTGPANIVTVFPDAGSRYLSKLTDVEWLESLKI
ncbi:MAG TPA: cystathionine beta-synthase [Rhodospirillaceae bacterium]|nr:cystathionine beta-synthase [Rhodospirillaceae bacterium]